MNDSFAQAESGKASAPLKVAVVLVLLVNILQSGIAGLQTSQNVAQLVGAASLPVIIAFVVLGVSRLFGQAKTGRSRAVILFWTLLVWTAVSCVAEFGHSAAVLREI